MPRRIITSDRFLVLTDNLEIASVTAPARDSRQVRPFRRRRRRSAAALPEMQNPPPDPLFRARRLVLAAVRLWELRNGIHEPT